MLSAAGTRRARSLPPSTFSSGSLGGMLASSPRVTRFGPLRPALGRSSKEASVLGRGRKAQKFPLGTSRRSNGLHKMDSLGKKRIPDYTDIAYREAVSRLRYLLAESYTSPHRSPFRSYHQGYRPGEESGEEADAVIERTRALLSPYRRPVYSRRSLYSRSPSRPIVTPSVHVDAPAPQEVHTAPTTPRATTSEPTTPVTSTLPPEMMAYIERQEEYIDQLERESHFCRDELSNLLGKVKEVISENEGLQEKQKTGVLRSVLDYLQHSDREEEDDEEEDTETSEAEPRRKKGAQKERRAASRMEGPSIVFESRISELEAQLTQVRIDLKKAQDEAELYKKRLLGEGLLPGDEGGEPDSMRHQLENLKREKIELVETVTKLQSTVAQLRERESDASHRVKRTQESVDHATFERAQSELEVRRLKDELERLHGKLREAVAEQGRRAAEERSGVERRYQQQVEQLQAELATQWDNSGRLQMELEKQRRTETELRREISNKNALLDDMAKETQAKIDVLQGELNAALSQHGTLGQDLAAAKMLADRAEREAHQESKRLGAEVSALRERLDRADSETLRARQEALRLSEQLAALDREMTLSKTKAEVAGQTPATAKREQELMAMVTNMQDKHVETVAELEGMIQSQNQVMAKLKDECHILTQKLEDSSTRHKVEMVGLQNNIDYLTNKMEASIGAQGQREMEGAHTRGNIRLEPSEGSRTYEPVNEPTSSVYKSPQQTLGQYLPSSESGNVDTFQSSPEPSERRGLYEPTEQGQSDRYLADDTRNGHETSQRVRKFDSPESNYQSERMDTSSAFASSPADDADRTRNYEQNSPTFRQPERTASRDKFEITPGRDSAYESEGVDGSGVRGVEDSSYQSTGYQQPQRTPSRDALYEDSTKPRPAKYESELQQPTYESTEKPTEYDATERAYDNESSRPQAPYTQQSPSRTGNYEEKPAEKQRPPSGGTNRTSPSSQRSPAQSQKSASDRTKQP